MSSLIDPTFALYTVESRKLTENDTRAWSNSPEFTISINEYGSSCFQICHIFQLLYDCMYIIKVRIKKYEMGPLDQ